MFRIDLAWDGLKLPPRHGIYRPKLETLHLMHHQKISLFIRLHIQLGGVVACNLDQLEKPRNHIPLKNEIFATYSISMHVQVLFWKISSSTLHAKFDFQAQVSFIAHILPLKAHFELFSKSLHTCQFHVTYVSIRPQEDLL